MRSNAVPSSSPSGETLLGCPARLTGLRLALLLPIGARLSVARLWLLIAALLVLPAGVLSAGLLRRLIRPLPRTARRSAAGRLLLLVLAAVLARLTFAGAARTLLLVLSFLRLAALTAGRAAGTFLSLAGLALLLILGAAVVALLLLLALAGAGISLLSLAALAALRLTCCPPAWGGPPTIRSRRCSLNATFASGRRLSRASAQYSSTSPGFSCASPGVNGSIAPNRPSWFLVEHSPSLHLASSTLPTSRTCCSAKSGSRASTPIGTISSTRASCSGSSGAVMRTSGA